MYLILLEDEDGKEQAYSVTADDIHESMLQQMIQHLADEKGCPVIARNSMWSYPDTEYRVKPSAAPGTVTVSGSYQTKGEVSND